MASRFECEVASERELREWAAAAVREFPRGLVVGLIGPLGAGKTRWVQGAAAALGIAPEVVTSPTFVISQEYEGARRLRHVDLYRVNDEDEFWELGADEWFADDAVTCIEWADRWIDCLPSDRLEVRLDITGPTRRRITWTGGGPRSDAVVDQLGRRSDPFDVSNEGASSA